MEPTPGFVAVNPDPVKSDEWRHDKPAQEARNPYQGWDWTLTGYVQIGARGGEEQISENDKPPPTECGDVFPERLTHAFILAG